MSCVLHISKDPVERCLQTIIENEAIDSVIAGPSVYSMHCFTPVFNSLKAYRLTPVVPEFPLVHENVHRLEFPSDSRNCLVFGGGTLVDFAKLCARRNSVSLTILLASTSNDGFGSGFSSLRPAAESYNQSYLSKAPKAVYACMPLLNKHMPHKFRVSGIGELLSKLSVWEDVKMDPSVKEFDETPFCAIDGFFDAYKRHDEDSLEALVKQLYSFSLLMKHNSSLCSRSEHEFEKLYFDNETSHGKLVLMGAIVAMKIRKAWKMPHSYDRLLLYCEKPGLRPELKQEFETMLRQDIYQRMKRLSSVRPERFGLWNLVDSTKVEWKSVIQEIVKEL